MADVDPALALRIGVGEGGVPHRAPNGLEHLVALPNAAVGETDFEAAWLFAALHTQLPYLQSGLVGQ